MKKINSKAPRNLQLKAIKVSELAERETPAAAFTMRTCKSCDPNCQTVGLE